MPGPVLIPVLGDQLTHSLASLEHCGKADAVVLMMEVAEETTYVKHHKAKIALILSAMRHFAAELRDRGWTVDYIALEDEENSGSFTGEITRAVERHDAREVRIVEPGEWRVLKALQGLKGPLEVPLEILPDDRFLCSIPEFIGWAQGRRTLRMENFYREMRAKTGLLMEGEEPAGGQ